jgi:pimeloyl-ACP methyl ester carboxylesterase
MRVKVAEGVDLYVDVDGAGLVPDGETMRERPTIVLLHGGPGMDHSGFKSAGFGSLRDVAQVVYVDLRGQGRSGGRDPEGWNLDTWADDIVRLCEQLGIEGPIVVGQSFGGLVVQRYLERNPEHPRAVVLLGIHSRLDLACIGKAFEARGGREAGATATAFLGGDTSANDQFQALCMPLYSTEDLDIEAFLRMVLTEDVLPHFLREWGSVDLGPGLSTVTCPVLICGAEHDVIAPPELVEDMAAHFTNAPVTRHEFAGAGHMQVCGEAAVTVICEFVKALEAHWAGPTTDDSSAS